MEQLHARGYVITLFNRGATPATLPPNVERLYGDRGRKEDLQRALGSRSFDAVVDTTLYNGAEAQIVRDCFKGRTGHFIFISTGQVYLVREGLKPPFREEDYAGEVMEAPPTTLISDYWTWMFGVQKRMAESLLFMAWRGRDKFPVTSVRAPMINGERDHYGRVLGYQRRMEDGGPILVPEGTGLPLRHVYCEDVAQAVVKLVESGKGKGRAFNIAQEETVSLEEFLGMMAKLLEVRLQLVRIPRKKLEQEGLLPWCSPFSDPWMSELDNTRSKKTLGMKYTPLASYLEKIVRHYQRNPALQAEGYKCRPVELQISGVHS